MDLPYQHIIVAIGFALMGLAAFIRPRTLLAMLGLPAETPDSRNEIQAVYGGFGLAMAGVLIAPHWYPGLTSGIALTVGVALAGMAIGRLIAALRERPGSWPSIFFVIEAIAAGLLLSTI
ncbi:MAG TPA: DUF4345 family protein [Rhizomicrobium sp.]|jgi:hypothetical protein